MSLETLVEIFAAMLTDNPMPKISTEDRPIVETYLKEIERRPQFITEIVAPKLVVKYLLLPEEDKHLLHVFGLDYRQYIQGEGYERGTINKVPEHLRKLCRHARWTRTLRDAYDFYRKNRKPFETFSYKYLMDDKKFKATFGNVGQSMARQFFRVFGKKGMGKMLELLEPVRPRITKWTTFRRVLVADAPKCIVKYFDEYLQKRQPGDVFHIGRTDVLRICGTGPKDLHQNIVNNFDETMQKKIYSKSIEKRPEIKDYSEPEWVLCHDGAESINAMFKTYCDMLLERAEKDHPKKKKLTFLDYCKSRDKLKKSFGRFEINLYANAENKLREKGGFGYLAEQAAKNNKELSEYLIKQTNT